MATFAINPAATQIEYTVKFDLVDLEKQGWDFDTFYTNHAEYLAEKADDGSYFTEYMDTATAYVQREYKALVRLRTEGGKLNTYYSLSSEHGLGDSGWDVSGDDEKTVRDIIELLSEGEQYTSSVDDESEDADGNYVATFIQAVTA